MSDTPETDNETFDDPTPGYEVVRAEFARNLERNRNQLAKDLLKMEEDRDYNAELAEQAMRLADEYRDASLEPGQKGTISEPEMPWEEEA